MVLGNLPTTLHFSATAGANLVAAVTGQRINILALHLSSTADVIVGLEDSATSANKRFTIDAPTAAYNLPFSEYGWGKTAVDEGLDITVGGVATVTGILVYVQA